MMIAGASRPSTLVNRYRAGLISRLLEVGIMVVAVVRAGVAGIALRLCEHMEMGEAHERGRLAPTYGVAW